MLAMFLIGCADQAELNVDAEVPEVAAELWSEDGSVPFFIWEVVDGEDVAFNGYEVVATRLDVGDDAADEAEGAGGADGDGDGVARDADADGVVVRYALDGVAPPMAFTFTPLEGADDKAVYTTNVNGLRINFENLGYKSIKSQASGGTVTSTFYNKATSGSAYTTLYGPTTYGSCTYAYNCAGPYGMGVRTTWTAGSRTMTYTTTSSCVVSC